MDGKWPVLSHDLCNISCWPLVIKIARCINSKWVGVEIKTGACYHAQMKKKGKIIPNGVLLERHESKKVIDYTK